MNNMNNRPNRPSRPPQKRPAGQGQAPNSNNTLKASRPPLSPKERERREAVIRQRAEARRRELAREAEIRKKIKEENKRKLLHFAKLFSYCFVVYLLVLSVLLSVSGIVFFVNLVKVDKVDESDFIYYLAEDKKRPLPYSQVMRYGAVYINLSEICERFGMTATGSYSDMKFISDYNDEYVRFFPDSNLAEVNGRKVILSHPPVLDGDELWVPYDFITRYVDGISVSYNKAERIITVKRMSYGAKDMDISFNLKETHPIPSIPENDEIGTFPTSNE